MQTILIVDDELNTREALGRFLKRKYNILLAEGGATALGLLAAQPVDLVLSDIRMPGMDGLELLANIRQKFPSVAVILLTAYGDVETAVEAMRNGAVDYLSKPVHFDDLAVRLERALHSRAVERENQQLKRQLNARFGLENIIGSSAAMERVFDLVRQAAPSLATVLIEGPSGTGKELVAHAIHQLSNRASGPFVAVHCAALSATLLESELFGHEKGAYTGAVERSKGRFELADGGTLFLDEIGEIDPAVQVKLLRVLEERAFERVGGAETLHVDIRIVAATNRDLRSFVAQGKFREDLFYRLSVVELRMPALRERVGDIPMLATHFLREFSERNGKRFEGIDPDAMNALQAYSWPGNVRELRNTVERMVVLGREPRITLADVPASMMQRSVPVAEDQSAFSPDVDPRVRAPYPEFSVPNAPATRQPGPAVPVPYPPVPGKRTMDGPVPSAGLPASSVTSGNFEKPVSAAEYEQRLEEAEKKHILEVLQRCRNNRTQAAEALGISRRTLHRKLAAWGFSKRSTKGVL